MAGFDIDPAFDTGSVPADDWALSHVRLQDDDRFPWLILIPRRVDACELEDLSSQERVALMDELVRAGRLVREMGAAIGRGIEKLNVAALGNVTPQLHLHVVGRRRDDACWPAPVWGQSQGQGQARPYTPEVRARLITLIREAASY